MNKVRYNLKNTHYAKISFAEDGSPIFATPVRIPGAVSLSLSPEGDTAPFFADGIKYYTSVANNGYSGDFEAALIPDTFRQDILGEVMDTTSKVLTENAMANPSPFAFLFEFDGDQKGIRHALYHCTASRPTIEGSTTTGSKDVATEKLTIDIAPLENGMVKSKTTDDTTAAVYADWYKQVWVPTEAPAE